MSSKKEIISHYQQQSELLNAEIKKLKNTVDKYSIARLIVFALGILIIYLFFDTGFSAVVIATMFTISIFLVLIKIQFKKQEELNFKRIKLQLILNELDVLQHYSNSYDNGQKYADAKHPYTDDLDIFGDKSLYAYVNRCASFSAQDLLAAYLSKPADKEKITERQQALQEIKQHRDEILNYRARLFNLDAGQLSKLASLLGENLSKAISFISDAKINWYIQLIPFVSTAILVVSIFNGGIWWNIFGLLLLINGVIYTAFKKQIDFIHENIGRSSDILKNYSQNLHWIEKTVWTSSLLKKRQEAIKNNIPVYTQIAQLNKIIVNLNYRYNPIVGTFLNLLFQWDLKQLVKLNQWHKNYNNHILKGFDLIAEFEVLISLATLDENHPDWIYPEIADSFCFTTVNLGHPLIPAAKRVNNDFELAAHPTTDVITGSNMAGKSTFLRTVGINMVLAYCGAKVCAAIFKTSVFNIFTYMRIKDSLADQTSTFKAEIDRLKMILDKTETDKNAFVLVDEMLRGTNSRDKYLGSKVFIKKLISQQTPGFIATHDLQIAELEKDYPNELRNFHFDIQVTEGEMFFDYKIKHGECKTFNASLLLKAIGLDVEE